MEKKIIFEDMNLVNIFFFFSSTSCSPGIRAIWAGGLSLGSNMAYKGNSMDIPYQEMKRASELMLKSPHPEVTLAYEGM